MTAAREIIDDRAVRAIIAGTGVRQRQQLRTHPLQLADVALNLRDFLQRPALHVGAVPRRIVEQEYQLATLFQIEPHLTRLAQQGQFIQMLLAVAAVAVFATQRRRYQSLLFVKTDRFTG